MPVAPSLYLYKLLHLLPHYQNYFPFNPSRLPLPFSLKHSFPSLPPSISLLSVFNPIASLNIPFGQFFIQVTASSSLSLIAFETALFASCFYISSYSPQSYSDTLPYVHLVSLILPPSPLHSMNMYLLYFFPSSSHTPQHMPLRRQP